MPNNLSGNWQIIGAPAVCYTNLMNKGVQP